MDLLFALARDHLCQSEHGDGVGDDHKLVEGVGEFPYEVVGEEGAEEDENECDEGVDEVEIIVDFFTEWFKIISPAFVVSKICSFGIQTEFDFVLQTVEHGV